MLTLDFVQKTYNAKLDCRIKEAREMCDKLRLHVEGIGLQAYLSQINSYENESQFEARKKHAISNKFLTEELLRHVDNAFHARGGSRDYVFKTNIKSQKEKLIEKLAGVKNHSSLSEYVEQVWFNKFVTDPNGLIFMEIKDEDITPTYKSIHSIRAYKQNGIYVDWVIFEPHVILFDEENPKDEDKKKERFWVADEKYYYLYEKNSEGVSEIEESRVDNSFGRVPAILCSDIHDNGTGWKKSPIDSQVELLNRYLISNSVISITEFFHNYLQQWTYVGECNKCHGSGIYDEEGTDIECPYCGGTGKAARKDVTDIIELRIPNKDGVKIDPPAGYIHAPVDGLELMYSSREKCYDAIFFSHWHTTISKDSKNETATGRFLDAQPVNNRLNKYSISIEKAHSNIAQFIGEYMFPETFEKALVQYGRRYLIETPDQIWDKYIKAKKDNAPTSTLDLLLSQFVESEFKENEQRFIYESKKIQLEPFVHWDILTVQKLSVKREDYVKKLYFSDWIQSLEMYYVIQTDIKKLESDLANYVKDKIPDDGLNSSVEQKNNENE